MMPKQKNFTSIFFENEYKELAGKKRAVIIRLVSLLLLTFTALGFAIGGLQQLKTRMDNPFTNWVDIVVSLDLDKKLKDINLYIQDQDTLDQYHLNGMGKWRDYHLSFQTKDHDAIIHKADEKSYLRKGRTIDYENDLFRQIINEKSRNLIYLNKDIFDEEGNVTEPCGIVVTEELMHRLGYSVNEFASVKRLSLTTPSGKFLVFVELVGVVKKLPSLCDFISTNRLWNIMQGEYTEYIYRNTYNDSTKIRLLSKKPDQAAFLREKIETELKVKAEDFDIAEENIQMDSLREYYSYIVRIIPNQAPSYQSVDSLIRSCKSDFGFNDYNYIVCGDDAENLEYPGRLTFNFNDLEKIRPFQARLYDEFDIDLSMEKVESRENFQLVTRLTSIMGSVLFIFGLLSILLYLGNLIQSHVSKIKPNLGTLKAMGLPNSLLLKTYSKVVLKLMFVGILVAIPCSAVIGWVMDRLWLKMGFEILHWAIPLAILLILSVVFYLVRNILSKALAGTPGDLIYERE